MADDSEETAKTTRQRRAFDWEAIESQYRDGSMPLRAIASEHGLDEAAIRKRARRDGWERDLGAKIRKATETELVRREVRRGQSLRTEKEIIKAASATRADIGQAQRARIQRLTAIADKLIKEVEEIEADKIESYMEAGPAMNVLDKATKAVAQLVNLERQAWAMDEPTEKASSSHVDDLIKKLSDMASKE